MGNNEKCIYKSNATEDEFSSRYGSVKEITVSSLRGNWVMLQIILDVAEDDCVYARGIMNGEKAEIIKENLKKGDHARICGSTVCDLFVEKEVVNIERIMIRDEK